MSTPASDHPPADAARFEQTRWSIVVTAAEGDSTKARKALDAARRTGTIIPIDRLRFATPTGIETLSEREAAMLESMKVDPARYLENRARMNRGAAMSKHTVQRNFDRDGSFVVPSGVTNVRSTTSATSRR